MESTASTIHRRGIAIAARNPSNVVLDSKCIGHVASRGLSSSDTLTKRVSKAEMSVHDVDGVHAADYSPLTLI